MCPAQNIKNNSEMSKATPRLRLRPEERVPQILDAALKEFSKHGFTGARMEDIARNAGLSKGGLYAHFNSKEAIFKALLDRTWLQIDWQAMPQLATGASTRDMAQWIVDQLHEVVLSPPSVALVRLLIPERERVSRRVNAWREELLQLRGRQLSEIIGQKLNQNSNNILVRHPWLLLSPVVHALLWRVIFDDHSGPGPDCRQAHVELLCALLDSPDSV